MKNFLWGTILGAVLVGATLWALGFRKQSEKPASSEPVVSLADSFPNKTITYLSGSAPYQLKRYGDLGFVRRWDQSGPRQELDPETFQALWDQFKKLPGLKEFQNPDQHVTQSPTTHWVIYLNDAAGVHLDPGRVSYSIPKDTTKAEYRAWCDLLEATVRETMDRFAAVSDGG